MDGAKYRAKDVHQTLDWIMKRMLDLGQSALAENQFHAFRKMTMDFFAEGKRSLSKRDEGRNGEFNETTKGVVTMGG